MGWGCDGCGRGGGEERGGEVEGCQPALCCLKRVKISRDCRVFGLVAIRIVNFDHVYVVAE